MRKEDRVVCVLTGNLLKDPDSIMTNVPEGQIVEIDASLSEVERALG